MNRRGRPAVALTLLVASLALVGLVGATVEPPEPAAPEPAVEAGAEAVSGRSVCAIGDDRPGTSTTVSAVRPGAAGDAPAVVDLRAIAGGRAEPVATARLFPGSASHTTFEEGADAATDVRWSGAPVTAARSWRLTGEEDLPPGTAAGPCAPSTAATTWTVPGLTTEGGGEARLRLANPHPTGATVAVGFLTPEGPEDPTRLRNVSVGAHETLELPLNDYLPEQADLAAVVEVLSGRVAVEGVQLARDAIGGVDGVSLLQAATEPSEVWTVPWVIDGQGRSSWLWIANRTDRSAPVELTYHTADGGAVPELLAEVSVPPGTVRRVDLTGTLPEGLDSAALTARSDGVPVTVSGTAQLSADDPDETGFAVQLGAPASDTAWTLTGTGREGRDEQLRLINPGSEPATVDVGLWNGSTATQPPELTGLEVPAGSLVAVPLQELLGDAPSWALTVSATGGEVVAATVGSGDPEGPLHLVAVNGAPSDWWRTPRAPVLRRAPGTTQRLGTELGIEPIDPLAPTDPVDEDAPDPADGDPAEGTPAVDDDADGAVDDAAEDDAPD